MVSMPEPVVIKIEDDTSPALTVIDVENYVSTEDKITNWHKKVRLRINKTFGIECETSLEHLMKWYIEILNQEILNIDVNRQFILIMDKHMYCFYSYFKSLNWISTEGYLDLMEDILAFYLDCEGKIFVRETGRQKRNKKQMRKKLLPLLRIYLLGQEERIHHVLMKMRLNVCTEEAKSFLDNIFRVVFSQKPIDKSDAAFCRAFILNQKWKRIQQPDIWKVLDEMLETMYDRTLDSIHSNSIWKQIPSKNDSLLDVMAHIGDSDRALCDGYFKYMKTQNAEENIDAAYFTKIDSSSKSELDLIIDSSDTESSEFYKLIESCPKITEADEEDCIVKEEVDSDDDCIIITDQTLEIDPQKVVYEILDDKDDDIIEFADLQLKEPRVSLSNSCARRAKKGEEMSFLDSIEITTNPKATAGEKPALQTDSVSSPLTKLQNSDNDSVKSREILSRKFTRKKEAAPIIKTTKSNYDAIELPDYSMRLVGAARGMISRSEDDRAKMYMPHSTISSNNSPKSTESTETRPSESYVSPTSPDISSTCDPNAAPEDESDLSDDNHHNEPEKDETCDSVEAEPVIDQRIEVEEKQIEAESISEQQIEAEPISEQHIEAEPIADERIEAESIADERIEAEPIVDQLIKTEPVLNNNSHTYNIPTVNDNIHNNESYMKNVPCPLPPCASLTYLPLILSPLSRTTTTFDVNMVNSRQRQPQEPVLHQETQAEPCEVRQNESLPVVEEQIEAKPCAVRRNESEQVIEEQIVAEPCADQPIEPELLFKESIEAEPCTDRRVEADPIVDESIEDELFTDDHNSAESVTEDRNEIELFADSDDHIEAEPCMVNQNETQTFVDDWNEAETDVDNRNEAESVANECDEYKPTDTDNEIESLLNPLAVVEAKNDIISRKKPEYFLDPLAVVEAKKEIINRKKPKSTLDPLAAVTAKKDIISPKKLVKLNGRNGETSDIWSVKSSGDIFTRIDEKQLSKKNGTNNKAEVAKNKMEVIFTHKVKRSNNEVHLRYDDLKDNHGLDDSLVGDKSNISRNVTVNGVSDFDLFADPLLSSLEYQSTSAESPQRVVTPASTSSPSDLKSPEYDGIDDFKNYYLANYQQDCSQSASAKRKGENSVIIEKSDQNKNLLATQTATPITTTTTTKSLKRKRITFAKENTVYTIDTLAPPMANVKSIDLEVSKKPAERCLRILISKMKLKSLASYKDKPPSDLQSKPVVTERISKTEIKEYKKRKRRNNHNVPNTATTTPPSTPSQRNDNTMKLLQIDYDKSTPWPSESDTVHFSSLEETWRTNNNRHHQRFDTFDEGRSVYNGRKVGKRKIQRSGDEHEVRKRGRPKKTT